MHRNPQPIEPAAAMPGLGFELRFQSLFHQGRALAFPCDERGTVNLDGLSERARNNYFFARGGVGRDFASPAVVRRGGVSPLH